MQIKKFESFTKINEAGDWNKYITWEYVKENPDCYEDECLLIKQLENDIEDITELLTDNSIFELCDIVGFDLYQGAYAKVKIFNKMYKIWKNEYDFFIENFPIDNTDENESPGFKGDMYDIAEVIDNFKLYTKIKKYNI